jgi:hypothetical protein
LTSMEYEEVMGDIKNCFDNIEVKGKKLRVDWLYSWDNDKVHVGADLTKVGIEEEDRFELPALSSDMHKVVEHVHAWLSAQMQLWLEDKDDEKITVAEAKAKLTELFKHGYPLSAIQKDVASLKDTYKAVADHQGGQIPAAHR